MADFTSYSLGASGIETKKREGRASRSLKEENRGEIGGFTVNMNDKWNPIKTKVRVK